MPRKPPNSITRERERQVWQLAIKGHSQTRISEVVGIPQPTVCRMLQRVNAALAKEFTENALEIRAQQTVQLEHIASEAMRGWEESEGEIVIRRETINREPITKDGEAKHLCGPDGEVVTGEDGQPVPQQIIVSTSETKETRQQLPDPRYLAEARGALADIRKIWGLDAVKGDSAGVVIQKAYINVDIEAV